MTSSKQPLQALLIEDNPVDAKLITKMLQSLEKPPVHITHLNSLRDSLEFLETKSPDIVLLDLNLRDSRGIKTFSRVRAKKNDLPIIVLSGIADDALAIQAVHEGAQDYLIKDQLEHRLLIRSIHYAMERSKFLNQLRAMSITDDLTGLHNRRGFFILAQHQFKISQRTNRISPVLFIDLDDMKKINDTYGHQVGDQAIVDAAEILKSTFRNSDIISRVGGDEFAVLMVDGNQLTEEVIQKRLAKQSELLDMTKSRKYSLSFSIGVVQPRPKVQQALDDLLAQADLRMYEKKMLKKKKSPNPS